MAKTVTHATVATDPQTPLIGDTEWNEGHTVAMDFISLDDVAPLTGKSLRFPRINVGETAVEFIAASTIFGQDLTTAGSPTFAGETLSGTLNFTSTDKSIILANTVGNTGNNENDGGTLTIQAGSPQQSGAYKQDGGDILLKPGVKYGTGRNGVLAIGSVPASPVAVFTVVATAEESGGSPAVAFDSPGQAYADGGPKLIFLHNAVQVATLIAARGSGLADPNILLNVGGTDTLSIKTGKVGIGQTAFGTSAAKVLAIGTGTAPSTSPADCFQLYSADQTTGNACPTFRTENGGIVKLYTVVDARIDDTPNSGDATTDGIIAAIQAALQAHGLMAAA